RRTGADPGGRVRVPRWRRSHAGQGRRPDLHSARHVARTDPRQRSRGGAVDLCAFLRSLAEKHPLVEGRLRLTRFDDTTPVASVARPRAGSGIRSAVTRRWLLFALYGALIVLGA